MRNGWQAPEVLCLDSVSKEIVERNDKPRSLHAYLLYLGLQWSGLNLTDQQKTHIMLF